MASGRGITHFNIHLENDSRSGRVCVCDHTALLCFNVPLVPFSARDDGDTVAFEAHTQHVQEGGER